MSSDSREHTDSADTRERADSSGARERADAARGRPEPSAEQAERAERWGTLPPRVNVADLVEERPADPPNPPDFGRDPDRDWMLRYTP